jgi:hypothetical protein
MTHDHLVQFATVRQIEFIDAIKLHSSIAAAAKALGVDPKTIRNSLNALEVKAARKDPKSHDYAKSTVPDGFGIKGVSQYIDKEGNVAGQWVKTSADAERQLELMKLAVEAMCADMPRVAPLPKPAHTKADLCNLYVMTDCHVGQLAWHKETGEDWDLNIAEKVLTECFEHLVMSSPDAKSCVIAQLGDWLHSDGILPVTPTSGHILDTDSRFSKVVEVALRILRRMIDCALMRHEVVYVLMAEGNHDITSSIWLRLLFKALYENEPRVVMIGTELPYYIHQHGEVMLAFHHGHLKKKESLPLYFAAQFPKIWGSTKYRFIHTGHMHHEDIKEYSGVTVVQHATLAARDAHSSRHAYISQRQATATTYHAKRGRVATVTVTPEMICDQDEFK